MCLHLQHVVHEKYETAATFQHCLSSSAPFQLYYYGHHRHPYFEWDGESFTLNYLGLLFTVFGTGAFSMLSS